METQRPCCEEMSSYCTRRHHPTAELQIRGPMSDRHERALCSIACPCANTIGGGLRSSCANEAIQIWTSKYRASDRSKRALAATTRSTGWGCSRLEMQRRSRAVHKRIRCMYCMETGRPGYRRSGQDVCSMIPPSPLQQAVGSFVARCTGMQLA